MRDISTDYLDLLTNVRRIGATMTFRDKRLIFEPFASGEPNLPELSHPDQWDVEPFGKLDWGEFNGQWAGFLRVCRNSDGYLCWQAVYDHDSDPPWDGVSGNTTAWNVTSHQLLPCKPGIARIGTSQAMIIYAAMDLGGVTPDIVSFYWSPGGLSGPFQVGKLQRNVFEIGSLPDPWDYPDNTGLAFAGIEHVPNGAFRFALQYFPYSTVRDVNYAVIQLFESLDQNVYKVSEFPGAIYGDMDDPYRFDAEFIDDHVHFFTSDNELGRPITLTARPAWVSQYFLPDWSDTKQVFPLDVLDDTSFMTLGHVTNINDELWVTGRIKRGDEIEMDIYMRGNSQGNFSLGRDMYIGNSDELRVSGAGKLIVMNNKVFYVGHNKYAVADATSLVGVDNIDKKILTQDIIQFGLSERASSSWTCNSTIRSDLEHDAIRKNAEVTLHVGLQDTDDLWRWEQMGVFGVDALTSDYFGDGNQQEIMTRGLGTKMLSQWTSDAFYDYWSQAKLDTDPAELSEVIRSSGQWETYEDMDEEPLKLDRLNETGILYTSAKASRNGQCSAKFYLPDEEEWEEQIHSGRAGVGINYYRESKASAADRLGIEADEVTESQYGDNGLFAVYEPSRTEIVLYAVYGSEWYELASDPLDPPSNAWFWLSIKFNEGRVLVQYALDDGDLYWSKQIDYKFDTNIATNVNIEPWFRDQRGRGAVVVENVSIHSETPGFQSTSDIIPIDDMSEFPAAGRVLVDSEIIDYNDKKDVPAAVDGLTMNYSEDGLTWAAAPHYNDLWTGVKVYHYPWTSSADDHVRFARSKDESQGILQSIPKPYGRIRIDSIRVPMVGIREPFLDVYAWVVNDDFDNAYYPQKGIGRDGLPIIQMVSAPVAAHTIPSADDPDLPEEDLPYAWVEFDMTATPESMRWLDPFYSRGYWIFITVIPPIFVSEEYGYSYGTDWNAYQDTGAKENYFYVKVDHRASSFRGLWRTWSRGTGWDNPDDWWNDEDATMPYEIYGAGNTPSEGYEIYVEGPLPALHRDALDGAALVATAGPGAGSTYRVLDYDYQAPDRWVPTKTYNPPDTYEDHVGDLEHGYWETPDLARIFVATNPRNAFGDETEFQFYDALAVEERGIDETTATAHGPGNVSIYTPLSVLIDRVKYFSGEMDMRLEDMAREICAKAGVLDFSASKDYDGDFTPWDSTSGDKNVEWMPGERRNGIVKFTAIDTGTLDEYGIIFRSNTNDLDYGYFRHQLARTYYVIAFKNYGPYTALEFRIKREGVPDEVVIESVTMPYWDEQSRFTFSFQVDTFSVWMGNRHFHTFSNDELETGEYCGFFTAGVSESFTVDWSQLDLRIDNFVLDLGYRGAQLLSSLIGPKKVIFADTQTGGIHMERIKTSGDPDYTLADLTVEAAVADIDINLINRVRAEGAEIAEVVDWESLREDGNLFTLVNATEANDLWETANEAKFIIADSRASVERHIFTGAADPRVEPNDIVRARSTEGFRDLIVDSASFGMESSGDEVRFDMTIEGRNAD